ncbi:hypothetical protein AC1031_000890 [Aphanomyces cochlioides]|nr:hypothetical protein AC1031_000890 [Aphanomyces cochlioides]
MTDTIALRTMNSNIKASYTVYAQNDWTSEPVVILDPNSLAEDGTFALVSHSFSKGKSGTLFFAYGVSNAGSDWLTIKVLALHADGTVEHLKDCLELVNFSNISDSSTADTLRLRHAKSAGTENPGYLLSTDVSQDGSYLVVCIKFGFGHMVLPSGMTHVQTFLATTSNTNRLIMHKVVDNISCHANILAESTTWIEVIPEADDVVSSAHTIRNDLIAGVYLKDASDTVRLHKQSGEFVQNVDLPSIGTVKISCKRDSPELFFKLVSFLHPGSIYHHTNFVSPCDGSWFSPDDYETKQVWYQCFWCPRRTSNARGHPNIPERLRGFNRSLTPYFSPGRIVFIQHFNGLLALPSLRGGGEYGKTWHDAGTREQKQNVFDDFQCAAEYLISEGYTIPSKIATHGGSNGGLLVAACANQRPDLFKCAVAVVGVMDMLRFHKFTIEDFEYIYKYSPLRIVPSFEAQSPGLDNNHGGYPAMLLKMANHDDRVVPLHSYKFIAGQGEGKPTTKMLKETSHVYAFMAWALGAKFVQ